MSREITRRKFLGATTAVTVGAALAACTPTPTPQPPTKAPAATTAATQAPAATTAATKAPATATAAPTAAAEKPIVEITLAFGEGSGQPIIENAPAHLAAGKATRTKLRFQTTGSTDWPAKQKTLLATAQVPDIMGVGNAGEIRDFAKPSVLRPIMPLIEKYGPNLKRYLAAYPEFKRWAIDGEHYIIPKVYFNRPRYAPVPNIRSDWMEALGLPVPADWDQLYQVLKEMKKAHPDAYWTSRQGIKRLLMLCAYPMGSGLGGWFRGKDCPYFDEAVDGGKWLYGPIHPEFKEVLAYFAKAYKEGILDPDVATTTADQWHQMNSSGKGFFTYDNFTFQGRWLKALRETDPKARWTALPTPKGKRGARQNDFFTFEGGWVIGAGSKNPDRVIELFDWMVTPEGIDTTNWGVEGEHYVLKCPRATTITDYTRAGLGKAQDPKCRDFKPEVLAKYKDSGQRKSDHGVGLGDIIVLIDGAVLPYWEPQDSDILKNIEVVGNDPAMHPELLVPPFTKDEIQKLKDPQAAVDAIMNPALDKVVLGQMSLSEYDKAVQDAIKAGAQDLEKIYNEAEARMK